MIIKAGAEHAQILIKIGTESFFGAHKSSAPAHEIGRYMKDRYNLAHISRNLSNPKNIYHIIKHGDNDAGFSRMILDSHHPGIRRQNTSKMDQIYLLKSFQASGLGTKLLQHNIELSKANMQSGMWLEVWVGNYQAVSFYQKFHFEIIADNDFHLTDTHINRSHVMFLNY